MHRIQRQTQLINKWALFVLVISLANEFFVDEQSRPQLLFVIYVTVGAHNGIMAFYFQPRIEVTLDLSDIISINAISDYILIHSSNPSTKDY